MSRSASTSGESRDLRATGILIALLGTLLMSFDPIFIRFSGVGGFDTAFLFGLFTAISMPLFIQVTDKRGLVGTVKASGWPVLLSGLLMLGSASALVLSVKNTSVANTYIIFSITPALAAVFGRIFLREKTSRVTWLAIFAIATGMAVVVSGSLGSGNLIGDALALFAVTCVSLNHTLMRHYKDVSRAASVGFGGLFLAIAMSFFATPSAYDFDTWLVMAAMGLFSAPFGRVLIQTATRHITAPEVGMLQMIGIILSPFLAFGIFGEVPPVNSFIGGAMILLTILAYILATTRKGQ